MFLTEDLIENKKKRIEPNIQGNVLTSMINSIETIIK